MPSKPKTTLNALNVGLSMFAGKGNVINVRSGTHLGITIVPSKKSASNIAFEFNVSPLADIGAKPFDLAF